MAEQLEVEIPAGRRHIIERPRLTRLLDATSARVIMLVAPAGYGKTTLAREWLAKRPHAWYQANAASADVAGLAVALSESLAELTPTATQQLSERLLATRDASLEVAALAQIQAAALYEWPEEAWLAVDEYQYIAESEAAQAYVHALLDSAPLRMLLTSRVRPSWATSRDLLYGHFYEVSQSHLAMDDYEARRVLARRNRDTMGEFLRLADGWPAVIGLAALTDIANTQDTLPESLYEFLADELYKAASLPLQTALRMLALCPPLNSEMLDFLFESEQGPSLIAEAKRLGFFATMSPQELDLHPLLRAFLLRKLGEGNAAEGAAAARRIANFLLERELWDDVFDLLRRYPISEVLIELVEEANDEMLRTGRLGTLAEWLEVAAKMKLDAPIFDVVSAEVSLRQGNVARAESVAMRLGRDETIPKRIRSRALSVAGQAARLDNRDNDALTHYKRALLFAEDRDARRRATWGKFGCFHAYRRAEERQAVLDELLREEPRDADELLQSATAKVMVAVNMDGLSEAVESASSVKRVVGDARDPLIRTSYLNMLARTLSLLARYSEAAQCADDLVREAEATRLDFVRPHGCVAKAVTELGLRRFGPAEAAIEEARQASEEMGDIHNLVEAHALRCKLAVATNDFGRALEATADTRWHRRLTAEMLAEYLANRALALACVGQTMDALALATEATGLSALPEVGALVRCVRAIVAVRADAGEPDDATIDEALTFVFDRSLFDPLVVSYRGFPELLRVAASSKERERILVHVLTEARDTQLARAMGINLPAAPDASQSELSPRENEVLDLLGLGYSNREIAAALYIAETTAKVHVRQILRKLGVRSRTEAALVAARRRAG